MLSRPICKREDGRAIALDMLVEADAGAGLEMRAWPCGPQADRAAGRRRSDGLFRDAGCLAVPGAGSIVGTGDIFGDRLTQPIHVPRRGVCLSKRDRDAGFSEGIENGDP